MNTIKKHSTSYIGFAFLFLLASWVIPPVVHKLKHLCPIKPDGINEAQALPMWARRYGVNCAVCHTTYPRLTKAGYMFRRAGYRWPDDIGKDVDVKGLTDNMISVRNQVNYEYQDSRQGTPVTKDHNGFIDDTVGLHALSGALNNYFSSRFEFTYHTDSQQAEVENANLRMTLGKPDVFFSFRGGVMHPYEGYGASDLTIGNFDPLFQSQAANNNGNNGLNGPGGPNGQSTVFTPSAMSANRLGVEAGATLKDSNLTVSVFNGLNSDAPTSAVNQPLSKPSHDEKDFQVFFNQFIGNAALSVLYYNGTNFLPDPTGATQVPSMTSTTTWKNATQRVALYAYYPVVKHLDLLGGYMRGKDDIATNPNNNGLGPIVKDGIFHSWGYFLGVESLINSYCTVTARYDFFDPSQSQSDNKMRAGTVAVVLSPFFENMKFGIDYQYIATEGAAPMATAIQNNIGVQWFLIF